MEDPRVTPVCGEHGRVIVLEDDLMTAPTFLPPMVLAGPQGRPD